MGYRKVPLSEVRRGDVIAHYDETGRHGDPVWNKVTVAPSIGGPYGDELEIRYQPVEADPTGMYGSVDGRPDGGSDAYAVYSRDAEVLIQD